MARPRLSEDSPSVRFQMKMPESLLERVNEYRHEYRIASVSEAIRVILEAALPAGGTVTDIEQIAYWKGAYERMAARNHELAEQLAAIKRIEQGQAKERAA